MNSNTRQQVLRCEGGREQYWRIVKSFTVQSAGLVPSHPHTSPLSLYKCLSFPFPLASVVWSGRQARCEVTCFDVHYGNLGQIHSVQVGNLNNKLERWEHIENISNTLHHRGWSTPCQHGGGKNVKYFDKFAQSHYSSTIKIIDDAARIEFIKNSVLLLLSS